jgi:hypothetical protein
MVRFLERDTARAYMPIINGDHEYSQVRSVAIRPVTFDDVRNHLLPERHFDGLAYREFVDARVAWVAFTSAEVHQIVELIQNLGRQSQLPLLSSSPTTLPLE